MTESDRNKNDGTCINEDEIVRVSETHQHHHATLRKGTISSARFNILCTMVGGGCLSLPMAFQKTGGALLGPLLVVLIAAISHYCFHIITVAVRKLSPVSPTERLMGQDSFESLAFGAFGTFGLNFSKFLVTAMCFCAVVGYSVLLRDLLEPATHAVFGSFPEGPSLINNSGMLTIVLIMTPVCTLETLSALRHTGAASMSAIVLLGLCLVYRSTQCNLGDFDGITHGAPWSSLTWWPNSVLEVLDGLPIFICSYVCHFNIPLVHNELTNPTEKRISLWLTTTTWAGTIFYLVIGVAGAAYGHCTASGQVQGNILLDFDEDDPLLLVARFSLAITVTLALPLLVVPARNVLLETFFKKEHWVEVPTEDPETLQEPLLNQDEGEDVGFPFVARLVASIGVLWTAAALASCVHSIAVVWDLLGSSLSVFVSYLIPCGAYIVIVYMKLSEMERTWKHQVSFVVSCLLIVIFTPLMIISTYNAVVNTFFARIN